MDKGYSKHDQKRIENFYNKVAIDELKQARLSALDEAIEIVRGLDWLDGDTLARVEVALEATKKGTV